MTRRTRDSKLGTGQYALRALIISDFGIRSADLKKHSAHLRVVLFGAYCLVLSAQLTVPYHRVILFGVYCFLPS
jgi:hypothetical protein